MIELPSYLKAAASLFTEAEREEIVTMLATDPFCGDVIPGAGGFRKVRVGRAGMGKRGGARVIYVVRSEASPIFLVMVYAKNDKASISPRECSELAKMANALFGNDGRK